MKQKAMRKMSAFTIIEMLLIIFIVVALAAFLLPFLSRPKARSQRITCINNLKQIGTAYRIWSDDNGNRYPAEQTVTIGGWGDFLTNTDQGAICWTNYAIMANELGQSPRLLICPEDERMSATNFATDFKDNTHLSYFVGVSANDTYPQSISGGDRNLGDRPTPARDYGFSPKSGKGNDVAIPTNSLLNHVSWTPKMHSDGNTAGAGNILLGDSSAQQVTSANFRQHWLSHAEPTTNWPAGHVPAAPSIRVLFP